MKKQLSSHKFPKVYEWLGINLSSLGCVMLDVSSVKFSDYFYPRGIFYKAKNKERFWIDGDVSDTSHLTLLYGLLEKAWQYEPHIKKVLQGWKLLDVEIEDFGYFESPYPDEPYYCIIAHIRVTDKLIEGHRRLEFLPHINTFAGYKPHITIAYIKKNEGFRDEFIDDLRKYFINKKLHVLGLNLGDK